MKNSKLFKSLIISIIGVMLIAISGQVFAADDNSYKDLTTAISGNNTTSNNSTNNNTANNTTNNTTNNSTTNNTTGNKTVYNNTANTLPKTGIGDTVLPVAVLIVVFGISAVYAYKKVNDYKNI